MSAFNLPITGLTNLIEKASQDENMVLKVQTRGLLSTMGGVGAIVSVLGNDCIYDIGDWMSPFVFTCKHDEIEPLRQLLEESLQDCKFDRDASALNISGILPA